ncbi:NYN domain-containing protein [Aeromonas mytilicola]
MHNKRPEREPDSNRYVNERHLENLKWEKILNDKQKAVQFAMDASNSTITPHKTLILVDLQGIYLAFHKWLSEHNIPIDDGLIIGKFAHLQIESTSREVALRLARSQPHPTMDLRSLVESMKINYVDDKPFLGEELKVLKNGKYLDISMRFELFYAPVPLKEIEWRLIKSAKNGSEEAISQLRKIKSGVVTRKGIFERNYKAYDDFVSYLKETVHYSGSHEGFFGYYVSEHGLNNFDEKEVDIRIAIRAMDALHTHEADSICIISSDQDFLPLHTRADDFGITTFQADLAKFKKDDKVGSKFKNMGDRFIRGDIDPTWPLNILTDAISSPARGHFATHNYSENELHALCQLHNELNDWKINLSIKHDGSAAITVSHPK